MRNVRHLARAKLRKHSDRLLTHRRKPIAEPAELTAGERLEPAPEGAYMEVVKMVAVPPLQRQQLRQSACAAQRTGDCPRIETTSPLLTLRAPVVAAALAPSISRRLIAWHARPSSFLCLAVRQRLQWRLQGCARAVAGRLITTSHVRLEHAQELIVAHGNRAKDENLAGRFGLLTGGS